MYWNISLTRAFQRIQIYKSVREHMEIENSMLFCFDSGLITTICTPSNSSDNKDTFENNEPGYQYQDIFKLQNDTFEQIHNHGSGYFIVNELTNTFL